MRWFHLFTIASLTVLLTVACSSPSAVPQPAPLQATVQVPSSKLPWLIEWEKSLTEVGKEGKVVVFSSAGALVSKALSDGFKKRYGLIAEIIGGTGSGLTNRIIMERRAGLYIVDILHTGTFTPIMDLKPIGALDPLKPLLLLPEVTDSRVWAEGGILWADNEKQYIYEFLRYLAVPLVVNENMVKPEEIKSYRDLLLPKWKENIAMYDPTFPGFGNTWFSVFGFKVMDLDFMRNLVKQNLILTRDHRQLVEWVVRGKYAIAIAAIPTTVEEFIKMGVPLRRLPPLAESTYVTSGSGTVSLINRAPHPNAAKIFINWLLTMEGQRLFSEAYGVPSARLDTPKDSFDPMTVPEPGVSYVSPTKEDFVLNRDKYMEAAREIFRPLTR